MTLVNMSFSLGLIPFAAHLADKGLPRLAATAGVLTVAALVSVPMLLAISSRALVAAWLMQVGARVGAPLHMQSALTQLVVLA
jgi:hypothetical protein